MATIFDWNAYMGVLQELALVEDDLRTAAERDDPAGTLADRILYERF